jgi:hypothetical protein
MEDANRRIFVRNEWVTHAGVSYDIRIFHDADRYYLEVYDEEGRQVREPVTVDKADCIEFKRFSNPNLVEDLVNRVKGEIRKRPT